MNQLENILLEHCYNMSILRRDASQKKKDSILDSLVAAVVRSETTIDDLISCIEDVNKGEALDIRFFENGGNIDNYIKPKWLKFSKALWRQRSAGLGTPNAASGEGELMFIFLSPDIIKPTRGDLSINNENIEIKGEGVRVTGKITGREFRRKTLTLMQKYGLTPNKANRNDLDAVEIEKPQHRTHWISELSKLNIDKQKEFISDYLNFIDNKKHDVSSLFNPNLDFDLFTKYIVKILYSSMASDRVFDKFVLLGDGTNAKILSNDINKFNEKVDNGEIVVSSDYFRINQDANLGWYIS